MKITDNHNLNAFHLTCKSCKSDDTSLILEENMITLLCNECEEGEEIKL